MTKSLSKVDPVGQFLLYQTEDGLTKLEVRLENESLWLTQAQMADLFQTTPQNITLHLKNIYDSEELSKVATCKEYLQVQSEGKQEESWVARTVDCIFGIHFRTRPVFFRASSNTCGRLPRHGQIPKLCNAPLHNCPGAAICALLDRLSILIERTECQNVKHNW